MARDAGVGENRHDRGPSADDTDTRGVQDDAGTRRVDGARSRWLRTEAIAHCRVSGLLEFRLCGAPHKKKNWLFTGSENGGKTMAVLFSVVSSCQRHGHDPFVYLRDVLERLPDHPRDRLAELLPDRWSPPKPVEPSAPEIEPAQ